MKSVKVRFHCKLWRMLSWGLLMLTACPRVQEGRALPPPPAVGKVPACRLSGRTPSLLSGVSIRTTNPARCSSKDQTVSRIEREVSSRIDFASSQSSASTSFNSSSNSRECLSQMFCFSPDVISVLRLFTWSKSHLPEPFSSAARWFLSHTPVQLRLRQSVF